jgi:hypothetical protein
VFDSVDVVDTVALLVTGPGRPVGFTTRITVVLAPWASVPRRHVTSECPLCVLVEHPGVPEPIPGVELRRTKPAGRWSTTVTSAAAPSPVFETVMV